MLQKKRLWSVYALLLLVALGFRLFIALRLPNDEPDDGRVYAQIAINVLEQHTFSHENQPPYVPSLIRLPGYPLFLAGVYKLFGHGNNTAVRVVQAGIDTLTCVLVALVAFEWTDEERKHRAALIAFGLAAVCPFTAIYVATVLTEVPTNFLAVATVLTVTLAFKATNNRDVTDRRKIVLWWVVSGLIAGLAVLFRPDSGLFAAAIGGTLVLWALWKRRVKTFFVSAVLFSVAFCVVLVPWTIRNYRVFHLFQPLSPTHGEMPGEFVPRGYLLWLRTWLDDSRYISPVLWAEDTRPIPITAFPASAFDSNEERERVAALLEKYNSPSSVSSESSVAEEDTEDADEDEDEVEESEAEPDVEMTPEIDAGFAQLGQERRARSPFRYYVVLPLKRAQTLWCDTHSQYYPFNGELLPLKDLDHDTHQQYWLPLFAVLTALYSLLGMVGAGLLWLSRDRDGRLWVLLAALVILVRLGFFATLENPEPRYTVELFPFLIILAGAGWSLFKTSSPRSSRWWSR
ncbi:MAG TPA: glycosyltransferase family 39 protein [Pyrinomonadaceae bacterium]|nr:glycosyltransferase family 39 protein [Pyrinomonadaceae bacterium]